MPGGSGPKQKGTRFERNVVNMAKVRGLDAKRAWGSDGRTLGLSKEVDVVINGSTHQLKVRRTLPALVRIPEDVDVLILGETGKGAYVVVSLDHYFKLLGPKELEP